MTDKVLYVLPIPTASQTRKSGEKRRRVAQQGFVSSGVGNTESVSSEPGTINLVGWYRGNYAEDMAQEFEELFSASGIDEVVYRGDSVSINDVGYYALENVSIEPPDARATEAQQFDGRLVKKGTRRSHWRALATNPVQVDNDFGNDTTAYVGVPAQATKIRWFNEDNKNREDATLVATRNAEHGDVEIYDADASSYTEPILLYDLAYDREGRTDVGVYDDQGGSKTDGNGVIQWSHVFVVDHEFSGNPRVTNGLRRMEFDEANNTINAETWNNGTSSWDSTSLGTSDWELFDFDLTEIAMSQVRAHVEFRDTTQSPTAYFQLDMALKRGYNDAQWIVPPDESGPTPSALQTLLDPIANGDVNDPQEEKTLVARSEARK